MPIVQPVIARVDDLLDEIVLDPQARAAARAELARLAQSRGLASFDAQPAASAGEPGSADLWTTRARPAFLYVMYALLLWSLPLGLIAAVRPEMATAISLGMTGYLKALPEPLYALFGTGYLGYTAARQWGKLRGTDR